MLHMKESDITDAMKAWCDNFSGYRNKTVDYEGQTEGGFLYHHYEPVSCWVKFTRCWVKEREYLQNDLLQTVKVRK